jgi:hypothetical protein
VRSAYATSSAGSWTRYRLAILERGEVPENAGLD